MCIYCDYCVYHHMSTELVSLYTLDKYYYYYCKERYRISYHFIG